MYIIIMLHVIRLDENWTKRVFIKLTLDYDWEMVLDRYGEGGGG